MMNNARKSTKQDAPEMTGDELDALVDEAYSSYAEEEDEPDEEEEYEEEDDEYAEEYSTERDESEYDFGSDATDETVLLSDVID